MVVISEGLSDWSQGRGSLLYAGRGAQGLLSEPLTAFFSSRQCPGVSIRLAMDWALEQSVLTVLLQARCPVVAVLARSVARARLPMEWVEPLAQGCMAVVSAATRNGRLSEELAAQRNEWVAALGSQIVVAHSSPSGRLAVLCEEWSRAGRSIRRLG